MQQIACRTGTKYFKKRQFSRATSEQKAEMPVKMLRVNIVEGIGPVIQIAEAIYSATLMMIFIINLINVQTPLWPTTMVCSDSYR